jgi:hypothetical protein
VVVVAACAAVGAESHSAAKAAAQTKSSAKHLTASSHKKPSHHKRKSHRIASWRRGQQKIQPERAREIQDALVREHYLKGAPSGKWDTATQSALQHYQADHGWQTKVVPDSRALIGLGLGPDHEHLLNPESAMTTIPLTKDGAIEDSNSAKDHAFPTSASPPTASSGSNAPAAVASPSQQTAPADAVPGAVHP